jgi:2,3-bisphosphoglycerate-independent phosphoglycerate mutase
MTDKLYLVILCGAADRACGALGGKTPFEFASKPALDSIAREGVQGLISIINEEIPPESDSGAMALLSYDPLVHYTGRGPLEGLGTGFVGPGDNAVSFRVNFASFDAGRGKLERRTSRDLDNEELQELAEALRREVRLDGFEGVTFDLMAFGRHRGILCFRSEKLPLTGNVSNTDPGFDRVGAFGLPVQNPGIPHRCKALDDTEGARNTAAVINRFVEESSRILSGHPVNRRRREAGKLPSNHILFRDGGDPPGRMQSFEERLGRTLAFYGQIPAEKGLLSLVGGRFTYARLKENEDERCYLEDLAATMLRDPADVVFVHIKSADEHGHDNRPDEKVAAIERVDRHFLAPLLDGLRAGDTLIVTSDHATPCELGIHSADSVPLAVRSPHLGKDATSHFGETEAREGSLPVTRAWQVLPYVFGREVRQ